MMKDDSLSALLLFFLPFILLVSTSANKIHNAIEYILGPYLSVCSSVLP